MKLVIDIDDKVYGLLKYFENGLGLNDKKDDDDDVKTALMRAVINGTPLPDNPTNGDMIKAIFPQLDVNEEWKATRHFEFQSEECIEITGIATSDWWNAQYREDGETE